MTRLADVELQLVMHGLQCGELLQFARCSQRLMHAAHSAFAWLHASPLHITLPTPPMALHSLQHSLLLRWASLSLTVLPFANGLSPGGRSWSTSADFKRLSGSELQQLQPESEAADRVRVRERAISIHALHSQALLPDAEWVRLLHMPCMQSLRVLRCGKIGMDMHRERFASLRRAMATAFMRAVIHLPHLHTLQLVQYDADTGEYEWLALMPSLTSLSVADVRGQQRERVLLPITACTKLRTLSICELAAQSLRPFLMAPNLLQLQSLTLERFSCRGARGQLLVTPADFVAVFSALTQLQSLELLECDPVSEILAHAHSAPALRVITLRPNPGHWPWSLSSGSEPSESERGRYSSAIPPPSVVAEVLTRCTELTTFCIVFHADGWESLQLKQFRRDIKRRWKRMVHSPELRPFGQRFRMTVSIGELQLDSKRQPGARRRRIGCSVQ